MRNKHLPTTTSGKCVFVCVCVSFPKDLQHVVHELDFDFDFR